MKKVLAYGGFDLFHIGHLNFLKRAKELGDYLIVGVATDKFNLIKGKISIFSYEERFQIVSSIKFVDEVFPANGWDEKILDIQKYRPNILVASEEWKDKYTHLSKYCELVFLPGTEFISSSKIKEILNKIENFNDLLGSLNEDERKILIKYISARIDNLNENT